MLILVSQSPVLVIDALVCCEGYKLFAMSFVRDLNCWGCLQVSGTLVKGVNYLPRASLYNCYKVVQGLRFGTGPEDTRKP